MTEKMISDFAEVLSKTYKVSIDIEEIREMITREPIKRMSGFQTKRKARKVNEYTVASVLLYYLRSAGQPISTKNLCTTLKLKHGRVFKNYKMFLKDYNLKNIQPEAEEYIFAVCKQLGLSQATQDLAVKLCRNDAQIPRYCKAVSCVYLACRIQSEDVKKVSFWQEVKIDKSGLYAYTRELKKKLGLDVEL